MYNGILQNVHAFITECTSILQNVQVIIIKISFVTITKCTRNKINRFYKVKKDRNTEGIEWITLRMPEIAHNW